MKLRAVCAAVLVALLSTAALSAVDAFTAKRIREARDLKELVSIMRDIERQSAAALAATDVGEIRRQQSHATLVLGRITNVAARSDDVRALCVGAAGTLDMMLTELNQAPAQAKLAAEHNVVQWRKNMAQCERALGIKGQRAL